MIQFPVCWFLLKNMLFKAVCFYNFYSQRLLTSGRHCLNWYFIDLMMNHICLNVDLNCFIGFRYVNVLEYISFLFFVQIIFFQFEPLSPKQVLLGGRAAEEVIYGRDTSKASVDYLADASWLARKILTMLA